MASKFRLGELQDKYLARYDLPDQGKEGKSTYRKFSEILQSKDHVDNLLGSNTFFHAKLGFYEKFYTPLLSRSVTHKIVHTARQVPKTNEYKPIVVIPRTASSDELNSLIANALNVEVPVWTIAPFSQISPSILINFQNFFVSFRKKEELEAMLSLFDFSLSSENFSQWVEDKLQQGQELESVALLITIHPSFQSGTNQIALFELDL